MAKFVLLTIYVCLVIANNVNWDVNGIEMVFKTSSMKNTSTIEFQEDDELRTRHTSAYTFNSYMYKRECWENNSANNNFSNMILEATRDYRYCVRNIINVTQELEIQHTTIKSNILVLKKYCKKLPELKVCEKNYIFKMSVCTIDEIKYLAEGHSFENSVLSFVCSDVDDKIAQFYSEGGSNCFKIKMEPIDHCSNIYTSKSRGRNDSSSNLQSFMKSFEEGCENISQLNVCIVNELAKCSNQLADIVQSFFDYENRKTLCSQFESARETKNEPLYSDMNKKDLLEYNSTNNNSSNTILEAKKDFEYCTRNNINTTQQNEIRVAIFEGDILVFRKYCKEWPEFKVCAENCASTLYGHSISKHFNFNNEISIFVIDKLFSFACRDLDKKIARYYVEGGQNCWKDKREAMAHCFNTSLSKYVEPTLANLLSFKFAEEHCKSMSQLKVCVVNEFEKCGKYSPADVFESFFDHTGLLTNCLKSAGIPLHSSISVTTLSVLAVLLGRIDFY